MGEAAVRRRNGSAATATGKRWRELTLTLPGELVDRLEAAGRWYDEQRRAKALPPIGSLTTLLVEVILPSCLASADAVKAEQERKDRLVLLPNEMAAAR